MSLSVAILADVDVVIVAHDAGDYLRAAVATAVAEASQLRVCVVDARSTDGSVDAMRDEFPSVRVIRAPNRGFAASNNVGIRATSGRYVLLLNPDAELAPGALAALVAYAEPHPRTGIVAPKVDNPDGTWQAASFGRFPSLAEVVRLKLWRVWQRLRGNRTLSPRAFETPRSVDWATGACMLVRRDAIEDVGLMDEGYFLYFEDTEWCRRMHDGGWDVVVEPAARVVHHLGKTATPSGVSARAYRESFYRYCGQHGLWGLAAVRRVADAFRGGERA